MKKTFWLIPLAIAFLCSSPARCADPPPMFSADPPEAGAAKMVTTYLSLLAAGEFEPALAMNDLRGMRQYLLDRRLAELKAKNPELTAKDIETMSVQIQLNDLNPARLQEILVSVMKDAGYEGMTWRIRGYALAPEAVGGHLVSIDARTAAGKEMPILLGIKKLGEQWLVAPEVIEKLMGNQPVVRVAPNVPTPEQVVALVDAFWKHWQAGEMDDAYALFSAEYRGRVPMLYFLQQAQELIAKIGIPSSWTIENSRAIARSVLGLGVKVQGSTNSTPTIMLFRKMGETWVLEDSQFHPPPVVAAPVPAQTEPSPFRSDLRPDLKPSLKPAASPTEPAPATSAPSPAKPNAPIGPDGQ